MTEVRLPTLGQSATEATLVAWHVAPGAPVRAGDVIASVETDKTEVEVEAPADGVLGEHLVAPGETRPAGTLLTTIDDPEPARARDRAAPGGKTPRSPAGVSPKARRLAAERGVDLTTVAGSGPDGLVVAADLPTAAGPTTWQGRAVRERVALGAAQATAARRLAEGWRAAPQFVQVVDVDVTRLAELRAAWKAKGGPLAGVTWTALLVGAFARSLARHPHLNAAYDDGHLVVFDGVHVGVAVDTDRGLRVPVVADADRHPLPSIAAAIDALTRTGTGADVASTASVSNLGAFGIRTGTPVLNPPEAVLLFAGAIEDRVVVRAGAPAVRTQVTLSFAFDHRATDGASAARFVADVRDRLERPDAHL